MLLRIIKTLAYIFVFSAISFTIVYLLNKNSLDVAQNEEKEITPDNYNSDIKSSLAAGSMIKITGTPDLLRQISQEKKDTTDTNGIQYYYVALKEYGSDFVIKIKPGKLNDQKQTFEGKLVHISDTSFGSQIKNALNNPINFDDKVNQDAAAELDSDAKNLISESSKGDFSDSTFVVLDGEVLNSRQIILGIILWTTVLSLFLITLFRRIVFQF